MILRAIALVFFIVVASPYKSGAQSVRDVEEGSRIRIRLSDKKDWHVGMYHGGVKDTLWIGQCVDCFANHIPLSQIDELDVSKGLPRSRTKQIIYFGLIGFAVGAIVGGVGTVCGGEFDCQALQSIGEVIVGSAGAVLGVVVGAVFPIPREHWRKAFPP
jgi:hypothetical protein